MKCDKCGGGGEMHTDPTAQGQLVIDMSTSHADLERWAWYCGDCNRVFCGRCCLPRWQALKEEEGLSGSELATKLNSDPDGLFFERPICPRCGAEVSYQAAAAKQANRILRGMAIVFAIVVVGLIIFWLSQ